MPQLKGNSLKLLLKIKTIIAINMKNQLYFFFKYFRLSTRLEMYGMQLLIYWELRANIRYFKSKSRSLNKIGSKRMKLQSCCASMKTQVLYFSANCKEKHKSWTIFLLLDTVWLEDWDLGSNWKKLNFLLFSPSRIARF